MRASILTIGTEITSGEIVNRNASDLAQKLEFLNIDTIIHLSVPDDPELMHKAFEFAKLHSNIILFTGGLGPTSDDLTREVISEAMNLRLELDHQVYTNLGQYLKDRQRTLKPGHEKQCMFPAGSQKFENPAGTALAFYVQSGAHHIFALPGPPKEIEAIWNAGLKSSLEKLNVKPQKKLYKWVFEGKGESEIAEVASKVFEHSGFLLGYRASRPQVILKVWVPTELKGTEESYFKQIETELSEWLVSSPE